MPNSGCLQVADELKLDDISAADAIRDVNTGRQYSFLVNAYKPRYYFWESTAFIATRAFEHFPIASCLRDLCSGTGYDMIRKLMLVGMLVVAGRGSIAQLFLGLVISFVTFSLQVRLSPVRTSRSSVVMRAWICSVLKRVYCLQYRHSEDNLLKAAVECASSESLPRSQHPRSAALAALTPR